MISFVKPSAPSRHSITRLTSACGDDVSGVERANNVRSHFSLEIEECACVQSE
jgi:hypothetical protein